MRLDQLVQRADELLATGQAGINRNTTTSWGSMVPPTEFSEFRAAALSFLEKVFGPDSAYFRDFDARVKDGTVSDTNAGMGILRGARGELAGGWVVTTRGIVSAEVFSDFLEMAEHLIDEHYKDAAAVMVGSVLEEHLRQLATARGIPVEELKSGKMVHRKADAINSDLGKSVYSRLDQKNVTAWLDLRNKGAHGD